MVKYGTAVALLLAATSSSSVQSFQSFSPLIQRQRLRSRDHHDSCGRVREFLLLVSSAQSGSEFSLPEASIGDAVTSVTNAAVDALAEAVSTEPDTVDAEIAQKKRKVRERAQRTKQYTVTLPLTKKPSESNQILSLGLTLSQINKGRVFGPSRLQLDSLTITKASVDNLEDEQYALDFDEEVLGRRLTNDFQGVVVASVVPGSSADVAGIKAGDILRSTSATLGEALWPKSTLDGVRSAVSSRKAVSGSIQLEFQRLEEDLVDSQYELTLTRPLGIQLKETDDGYVEVTGFTENAPKVVTYAVKVGDRVLAVDSSLGDRMWPVSTVEGVISAVTSRLPGQQITMRFERPERNMVESATLSREDVRVSATAQSTAAADTSSIDQAELIQRCRTILRRYMSEQQQKKQQQVNYVEKFAVPALVADKVLYVLANAGASVDSITLSMVMSAYLSCRQPQGAIRAFEAIVGLSADGSALPVTSEVQGKDNRQISVNSGALNVYTATALMKAHAINGDLSSVKRCLKALEGQEGVEVDGVESASWPGTGAAGSVMPDSRCYNIAISAAATSRADDGLELALDLFESMSEADTDGTKPSKDLVSYNAILSALTQAGRYDEAIDVFYELKRSGLKPDKYSYTTLVKAVASEGDVEELLYDMKEVGVEADAVMYNSIIRSLCEDRDFLAARKMVTIMEASGVEPTSKTYGILMNSLLKAGNPGACINLFESASADRRTAAFTENVYIYTTAIAAASALRDYELALELVSRMQGLGIKPNLKTLTAVMGACLASQKESLAAEIYRKIEKPDGYAMSQGLRALMKSGDIEEAFSIVSSQTRKSRVFSGKQLMLTYKELIVTSLTNKDYGMARRVFLDLSRKGHIPSKAIYLAMFEAMNLATNYSSVTGEADEKFSFLLFVIDLLQKRNLPCEGQLYTVILRYGNRLGGLPCEISKLLISAKEKNLQEQEISNDVAADDSTTTAPPAYASWEDLYEKYEEYIPLLSTSSILPSLTVRIPAKDADLVMKAEQILMYADQPVSR